MLLYYVVIINSIDVLELLLYYFSCIDCVDKCGVIFVFLVVKYGFVDNLVLLVRKGVKINCKIKLVKIKYKLNGNDLFIIQDISFDIFFFEIKLKFWGVIMFYVVVYGGYMEVVRFFFENGVFIFMESDVFLIVFQVVVENGYLEVVKIFYKFGGVVD